MMMNNSEIYTNLSYFYFFYIPFIQCCCCCCATVEMKWGKSIFISFYSVSHINLIHNILNNGTDEERERVNK